MNIYMLIWNNLNNIDSIMISSLILVFIVLLIANYYDLRYGIIPNKLSIFLMVFGIATNILIANALNNYIFMYCYIVYMIIVFVISFILWKMSFWGGGDLKLFCSIGSALSFIDILGKFYGSNLLKGLSFNSQLIVYPRIFSILINSIILSFPIVILLVIYKLYVENKIEYLFLMFSDTKLLIKEISRKTVFISDLKEGMILENYYFNSYALFNFMQNRIVIEGDKYNLRIQKFNDNSFYFSSSSLQGLTEDDIKIIRFAYDECLINYPNFKIKMGIPFIPSLTMGFLIFLVFGDLIYLFSSIF